MSLTRAFEEFERLADLGPEARADALRALEAEDSALAREVVRLLNADDRSSPLLGRGDSSEEPGFEHRWLEQLVDPGPEEEAPPRLGETFGAYRTVSLLGRGGMGEVYLAERVDGQFEQRVALKLLRAEVGSAEVVRRFVRERQILARLDHPHIARLLDGGVASDGRPYLAMELVEGVPIDEYCRRRSASVEEILRRIVDCCRAVDAAHRQLVVHRDLKPSNILVTDAGEVKLLDFGIAKVLADDELETAARTALTRVGAHVLTPRYAAPEQILGEPISTATDVYALGVVLYELLTGGVPHDRAKASWPELAAKVTHETVERPSAALRRRAGAETHPGDRVAPRRLEGDIDTILLKALHREPARRYSSAAALGDDIERHLRALPVLARPDTATYRIRKFVARHRGGVAAALVALLAILAGLGIAIWQATVARAQAHRAEAAQRFLQNVFQLSDPDRAKGQKLSARDLLDRGAARVDEELADEPLLRAEMQMLLGSVYIQLALHPEAKALYQKALATREGLLAPDDPKLAENYRMLGQALHRSAQYDEARGYFERARVIHEKNQDMRLLGSVIQDLGNLERAAGDFEKARVLGEQLVELRRAHTEPDSQELGKAINNLAIVHWRLRDHKKAAELFTEAARIHRKNETDPSALVAGTEDNLAMMLVQLGDHEGAKRHSEAALDILDRLYSEPHPLHAMAYNSAGFIAAGRGDDAAAIRYYERALEIYAKTSSPEHPDVAYPEKNLGQALARRGDHRGALARYERALALREKALGKVHPDVASSLLDVAAAQRALGDYAAAERDLRRAVEIHRSVSGKDNPRTATALLGLGEILALSGRPAEAKVALEECLAIRTAKLPAGDSAIGDAEAALRALPGVRDR